MVVLVLVGEGTWGIAGVVRQVQRLSYVSQQFGGGYQLYVALKSNPN